MKNKIISILVLICFLALPSTTNAQFFKKLKNKIETKTDEILGTDEDDSQESTSDETADNSSNKTSEIDNEVYEPFKRGETVIFEDMPSADENVNELPSRWKENNFNKIDHSEIVTFEGEKVIRVGERNGISPIVLENEMDYIPDNFTLEFDASFSANTGEQRYWLGFYDPIVQKETAQYEARTFDLTFTTFAVTDNLKEGSLDNKDLYDASPNLVWRHISISHINNNLDIYYDGQHIFRCSSRDANFSGINISRSEFSDNNRYIKNIHLATD